MGEFNRIKNLMVWQMNEECNFYCKYCYYLKNPRKLEKPIPVNIIMDKLNDTGKQWHITLTGGEPMIYPDFISICRELTLKFKIGLDTNLSKDHLVKEFAEKVNPDQVYYINASVHIEERDKRHDKEKFIENVLLLKEKKFPIYVSFVLYPTLYDIFLKEYDYFQSRGIKVHLKAFKGVYADKTYPRDYPDDMVDLIYKHSGDLADLAIPFFSRGIPCRAGKDFFILDMDGSILRCFGEQKTVLGNIFSEISFYNESKPCQANLCPCIGINFVDKKIDDRILKI